MDFELQEKIRLIFLNHPQSEGGSILLEIANPIHYLEVAFEIDLEKLKKHIKNLCTGGMKN